MQPAATPSGTTSTPRRLAPRTRRRSPARSLWPRRLKLTREGRYYIAVTFIIGFAAINTGNNLLYLLLGLLLSLIMISGVLSEISLRHLTVTRRLPLRAQVGRAHLVEIEVFNNKRRFPSYAVEVEDLREGQPADKRCFFLKITARSAQVAAYRRTPARRGRDKHVGFRIATRFPFGLFEKSRDVTSVSDLVIYPAVDPVRLPPDVAGDLHEGGTSVARGHGHDLAGLRPLREGDDLHDIYWRKSTVPGQLVLRERARDAQRRIELYLDTARPSAPDDGAWAYHYELRIRELASQGVAYLKRGDTVLLRTTAGEEVRVDHSAGADPLLRFLALLEPLPAISLPPPARRQRPSLTPAPAVGDVA